MMTVEEKFRALIAKASDYAAAGRHLQAIEILNEAIALDPAPRGLIFRADSLFELGKFAEAQADIDQVRKLRGQSPLPLVLEGMFQALQGKLANARRLASEPQGPCDPTTIDTKFAQLMKELAIGEFTEPLLKVMKPCFRLIATDEKIDMGCSKFGGNPHMPPQLSWPRGLDNEPLSFVAQINFAEFQNASMVKDVPRSGVLLFFYDATNQPQGFWPKDKGAWAVVHIENPNDLSERTPPAQSTIRFNEKRMRWRETKSLPALGSPEYEACGFGRGDAPIYADLFRRWNQPTAHQLFGHPSHYSLYRCHANAYDIQAVDDFDLEEDDFDTMEEYEEYAMKRAAARTQHPPEPAPSYPIWQLLFQLDSDPNLGMSWAEPGKHLNAPRLCALHFCIEPGFMDKSDYSNIWIYRESWR